MKRVVIPVLIILVSIFAFFPYNIFSDKIIETIRKEGIKHGVVIDIGKLEITSLRALSFSELGFRIPVGNFPLPIAIDRGDLNLNLLPLFLANLVSNYSLLAYGGEIKIKNNYSFISSNYSLTSSGKALELNKHPLLYGLGISGLLSFDVTAEGPQEGKPPFNFDSLASIEIKNGSYRSGGRLYGILEIPPTEEIFLKTDYRQLGPRGEFRDLIFTSTLGTAKGHGRFMLSDRGIIQNGNGQITLNLTDIGTKVFSGYLAVAAGLPPEELFHSWSIVISTNTARGMKVDVTPIR